MFVPFITTYQEPQILCGNCGNCGIRYTASYTAYCDSCCEKLSAELKIKQLDWEQQWPLYCKTCNGSGGTWTSYDPSPSGISLSAGTMQDFEMCPACEQSGMEWGDDGLLIQACPRCSLMMPVESQEPCPNCHWNWNKNPGDSAPKLCEWWVY